MTAATGFAQAIGTSSHALFVPGLRYQLTGGGNVFEEALPEDPDVAVAVKSFGGGAADARLPYDQPVLQLLFRGDEDPTTARDLWYQVYGVVQGAGQELLPDGSFLIICTALQSAPINIGPDENGRHRYSMNLLLEVVNATAQRPAPGP